MITKKKILLLEDDPNLGFILKEHLEMNGFTVVLCTDGIEGIAAWKKQKLSLCLVDVMLPKMDGFAFAGEVRRSDQVTPIIFLTAKSLKEDRIEGLKIGADDYITKPFSMEELLLRIRAVLKRTSGTEKTQPLQARYSIGSYEFDAARTTLTYPGGKRQPLTRKESEVLHILARNSNSVVEREQLLLAVWGDDTYHNSRSLDVYITKLRKHLLSDHAVSIVNVHGKGFTLRIDQVTKKHKGNRLR